MATNNVPLFENSLGLRIGHLNVCSLNPKNIKFCEIYDLFSNSKLDIIGISETWLGDSISTQAVSINGYNFVRCDRKNRRGGGVGFYISNCLNYNVVLSNSSDDSPSDCFDLLIVDIFLDVTISIGVLYIPPSSSVNVIDPVLANLSFRFNEFILMGDLNCNLLDSLCYNELEDICFRNNLSIIHNNKPTHFDVFHGSSSLLDVFSKFS